ncbi:MAG: lipocalin-like domain-containing protein, partial [Muribaculaceae bacterium]|nr:lipocalin-like domain-containing protein [Muribaculaceae bacterium]
MSAACTSHNGGDIGPYFGQWKLESITIDGEIDDEYTGNVFWQFQENVIDILEIVDLHGVIQHFGTWSADGTVLTLQYTYGDSHWPSGTGPYAPPASVHLPSGIFSMNVISVSSGKMKLSYQSHDGVVYR